MDRVSYETITVQDLLNYHKGNELDLNPWYQRRAVWTNPQKAYLINTIVEQKPVPTVYIRHTIDVEKEKSIREVVDGQQRLRSIIGFRDDEFAARHPGYKRPKKYSELKASEKHSFLATSLSVGYLMGATESDVIEIFGRINSVSKTLNAQEKRNAEFSGEFKQFCVKVASELLPFWRTRSIFSANDISRMGEVEFTADLTMNLLTGLQDYSPVKLKRYYKANDESFDEWEDAESLVKEIFTLLGSLDVATIKDSIFSRPPVLFSLCLVLKDHLDVEERTLAEIITDVDARAVADDPAADRSPEELAFINAISSSTQRIASRQVRDTFLRSKF